MKRWDAIGFSRPVWMVLQGFSWHKIKDSRKRLYPSFAQSRFMAYDAIVHGSRGIFYWGSQTIDDPAFRNSLYALTSELAGIESFLVSHDVPGVTASLIDDLFDPESIGVRARLKQRGDDFLLILVNEDAHRHLAVDISGLGALNGRSLNLLHGDGQLEVRRGRALTRMQAFEVKVFSTDRGSESAAKTGRDYVDAEGR